MIFQTSYQYFIDQCLSLDMIYALLVLMSYDLFDDEHYYINPDIWFYNPDINRCCFIYLPEAINIFFGQSHHLAVACSGHPFVIISHLIIFMKRLQIFAHSVEIYLTQPHD